MSRILLSIILAIAISQPAFAEIQTVIKTIRQPFGGSQSADDARIAAIAKAKREALEQAGTYVEALTVVKDSRLDKDEILAVTAGVCQSEVLSTKNYVSDDAFGIEVSVKVLVDVSVLSERVRVLIEDKNHLRELKAAREREKKLLLQITELQNENQTTKGSLRSAKLKKKFNYLRKGLSAVEFVDKSNALWNGEKYSDPQKAIMYLSRALQLDPNYVEAYIQRGLVNDSLKKHKQSIFDYTKAIKLDPNNSRAYFLRGLSYSDLEMYKKSIVDYDKAINLDPLDASFYRNRGIANIYLEQFALAIKDFSIAINIDPNSAFAYLSRGRAYLALKQVIPAQKDFAEARRLNGN